MSCGPTHHFGCDCHEKQWRERLEKAERERDDARETLSDVRRAIGAGKNEGIRLAAMRVKSERDEALEQAAQLREKYRIHHDEAERITAEIFEIRRQRDRLAEALEKCRDNSIAIQKIRYGWDGNCGATRLAEFIEEDCDLAIAVVKGGRK